MQVHLLCIFDNDNETELYKYEWISIFLLSKLILYTESMFRVKEIAKMFLQTQV
jgi:hypothetical protein